MFAVVSSNASSHTPPCVSPRNSHCHDKEQAQPWRVFHELGQVASFSECSERFCVIQEQDRMVNEISKKLLSHSKPGHKVELKAFRAGEDVRTRDVLWHQ